MHAPPWTERVTLRHAATPAPQVRLREPCGADELALAGVDTRAAVHWLDALLDSAAPCSAAALSASDRDALFAALHRALWGDAVVSSLRCVACGEMVDLRFALSALQRQLAEGAAPFDVVAPRTLRGHALQRSVRLPGADEEEAAAQLGLDAGSAQLRRAMAGLPADEEDPGLDAQLEALAPLLDVDIDARCVECGHVQALRFDIQSFVLQRLLDERERTIADVHALALGYGWSLAEISALPRGLRRAFVDRLAGDARG